ncbi:PfaD family polyunsaturated fatty acid/polyketide biosynthesis protein [Candidatus Sumerlaeota bacterium]|nr:PfaD family polyunsaturated fatty acid/polyketide biosynthesis protein [Candidatus Sumerlaeota bacterium]
MREPIGRWQANGGGSVFEDADAQAGALRRVGELLYILQRPDGGAALACGGAATLGAGAGDGEPALGVIPACPLTALGDATFCADHGLKFAYVAGGMANGINSEVLTIALGRAGLLSFYGAAGQAVERIEQAVDRIQSELDNGGHPYGFNLIHSPNEPAHELATVDLYLHRGVRCAEAAAYLGLTMPVVKYRVSGIYRDADGRIVAPNRVIAKVSRIEVATKFFSPPPEDLLRELVRRGDITQDQAVLAREIPMAQDITAEADSGGHTDNRPALAMLPAFMALRDRLQEQYGYAERLRVGLGGGIGAPEAAAAAFAMGAAYIVTGSVNQACVESGTCDAVRRMLQQAEQADVIMAPAADMFEMGVQVQVLKRGTMFAMRGQRLYELYRQYDSLDEIPAPERAKLEKQFFQMPFDEAWAGTREFFLQRDPSQVERAERDPKHKLALVFRSYLGQASTWANEGRAGRQMDYQVWCGPAMGAFNEWAKGSHLEPVEGRKAVDVALNLLFGAAVITRLNVLRQQGIVVPAKMAQVRPATVEQIEAWIGI